MSGRVTCNKCKAVHIYDAEASPANQWIVELCPQHSGTREREAMELLRTMLSIAVTHYTHPCRECRHEACESMRKANALLAARDKGEA